jgi:hypothetical protein
MDGFPSQALDVTENTLFNLLSNGEGLRGVGYGERGQKYGKSDANGVKKAASILQGLKRFDHCRIVDTP